MILFWLSEVEVDPWVPSQVLFQVILISYAKPLEDKFAYIEKLDGGIKLGCYGQVKGTELQITHYVVDSRGYRKVLTKPDEFADKMELTAKNGDPK